MKEQLTLKTIVALCKRRGFIFPGSEIYGGFANTYSYGPYGVELKQNIRDLWWRKMCRERENVVGLDGPILLHPRAWQASGHLDGFNDALIDCRSCKGRFRADQLVEAACQIDVEGLSLDELEAHITENGVVCPTCKAKNWTKPRFFNLMFSTSMGKTEKDDIAYLRPETAQAIFLDFKNVVDSCRVRIPFGIAQIGKAFRNEITPGNFTFRLIEFEQMEIEFFVHPSAWEIHFEEWLHAMEEWCEEIGIRSSMVERYEHPTKKLSHYSKRTCDLLYNFPFGKRELYGIAYRTDFDLKAHAAHANEKILYRDPVTQEIFVPHVIEPTFGLDRTILALLCEAYDEEELEGGETRVVLRFRPNIAPVKAAVFPLLRKEPLVETARQLYKRLLPEGNVVYDDQGAIGKRYRRQDEIGTPFCFTVDYESIENGTVTLRERDSMRQQRIPLERAAQQLRELLRGEAFSMEAS